MDTVIKSAIKGVLALAAVSSLVVSNDATAVVNMEKCYGIAKAAKNDCQTSTHSCAGTTTKDAQSDAFILVPKGICEKIVGSSLTDKIPDAKKS